MKKLFSLLLALAMCFMLVPPARALDSVQPHSDTLRYYEHKNKTMVALNEVALMQQVPGTAGRGRSSITITTTKTYTATLDVFNLIGQVVESAISSSGLFTLSVSDSLTVNQTFPIDNQNVITAIGVFKRYNIYEVDQYYVIDFGYTKHEHYQGRAEVQEPNLVFFDVYYP